LNPETILLIARLASVGLGILTEMNALLARVQAGEEITDAEIDASGKRVNEAVARWNQAVLAATARGEEKSEPSGTG